MGPVSAEIEIDVPRERAFALLADLAERPSFCDHFLGDYRLTRLDSRGVGAGARFRARSPLLSQWMDSAIVAVEEPFRIVEEGCGGRVNRTRFHTVWELTGGPATLTRVRVVHWSEPANPLDRGLELLAAVSFWRGRQWREALRRLRERLESERPRVRRVAVAGGNRYLTGVP